MRKRPMSRECDDEEIPLLEVYKSMKRNGVMSTEDDIRLKNEQKKKKKNSRYRSLKSIYEEEEEEKKNTSPISKKRKKKKSLIRSLISIYQEEDNEKKNTPPTKEDEEKKPIPVYELSFERLKLYRDDEEESDEEVLSDRERPVEYDYGCKFVINQDKLTYTRFRHPVKVYYKSHERRGSCVLDDLNYPVSTVSKKALDRYNAIEGTNYEYVGLVKAYKILVDGFHYTVHFKARLPDQDPIYFQAMVWQRIPDMIKKIFKHQAASASWTSIGDGE